MELRVCSLGSRGPFGLGFSVDNFGVLGSGVDSVTDAES